MASKTAGAKPRTLTEKIQSWEAMKESGKKFYQQADELQDEIEKELKLDAPHSLGDGREAVLTDPWAKKTKVWRHTGVRRYDIDIRNVKANQLTQKL